MNFKMSELIYSDTAIRHNINNMPDINSLDCMLDLICDCLQPLRNKLKKPMIITSGYRNSEVNKLVGGVKTSQHCKGQACDFIVKGMPINQVIEFIKNSGIEFDQCISEYGQWVHISYNKGKNRKQFLKY
jgi:uncharacterized protein YcbK (DUF882 family)